MLPYLLIMMLTDMDQVALARLESTAEIEGASNDTTAVEKRAVKNGLEAREVWDRMNGPPGNLFYTGEFDSMNQ